MTTAIRILKASRTANSNVEDIEREEMILAIASKLAENQGNASAEEVSRCAEKIRLAKSRQLEFDADHVAEKITDELAVGQGIDVFSSQCEIDVDRLMSLLND